VTGGGSKGCPRRTTSSIRTPVRQCSTLYRQCKFLSLLLSSRVYGAFRVESPLLTTSRRCYAKAYSRKNSCVDQNGGLRWFGHKVWTTCGPIPQDLLSSIFSPLFICPPSKDCEKQGVGTMKIHETREENSSERRERAQFYKPR
jgi:hypothetical protein